MAGRSGIDTLLYLMEAAFGEPGDDEDVQPWPEGEINHLRSLLGPDDRWRHIQLGSD